MDIDLCDRRGRLVRLVIAATIGLVVTLGLLHLIRGVAATPNPDAVSQVSPIMLGMAMFVVFSYGLFVVLTAIQRWAARGPHTTSPDR